MYSVNSHSQWRVKNVALILTIISTENHLSIICADKDHSSLLGPRMAREVGGDVTTLLQVVDLRVVLSEDRVVLLFSLLHVNEGVAGASDKNG